MAEQTVTLRINANADGLVTGVGLAKKQVEGFGKEGEHAGQRINIGMSAARRGLQSISQQLENTRKQVLGFAAAYASLNQVSNLIRGVVSNTIAAEQATAQLDAVLRSTGGAMGYTRGQLQDMAQEMQRASTFGTAAITEAQTRLLSYSGIVGENFPRAMQAVIDQSARLNMSMEQSAESIGRALESPTKAAEALSRQGFGAAFTDEVKQVIDSLVAAGREADAQVMILEILEESYAGAAQAARNTLGGALQALKEAIGDLMTVGNGLPAARQAIEDVIAQISRPEVRQAFDSLFSGIIGMIPPLVQGLRRTVDFVARFADEIAATARLAAHLAPVLLAVWGASLIRQATAFTAQLVAQARQYVINIALAKELGVVQQQSFAASLKSIGLVNAALGTAVSAFAGWQIGTWLREEFVEVERAGIALVAGLLNGWERVKTTGVAAWEAIKAAVLGAINTIRDAASKIIGFMATVNEATDIGGFKSGITEKLREMQQQLAPTTSAWGNFKSALAGALNTMHTNQAAIDDNMFALWESAGASREAAKASGNLEAALSSAAAAQSKNAKASAEAVKAGQSYLNSLRTQVATYGMNEAAKRRHTLATTTLTAAQRAEAAALLDTLDALEKRTAELAPAHAAVAELARGHADLDEQLARNADALAGLTGPQQDYSAALREQNRLMEATLALGDPTEDMLREHEERLSKLAEKLAQEEALDAMAEAARAAAQEAQALEGILSRFDNIGFSGLIADMERVKKELADATDPKQIERLQRAMGGLRQEALTYATDALGQGIAALKSMSSEGSKALAALETAQTALNLATAIGSIANQGMGDPYTAFARIAAMAALMSQLVDGIGSIRGGFSDTAAQRQAAQGAGTVLGDAEAKSESIARATEITANATTQLVGINRSMLSAMQSMRDGLSGASALLARGAGNVDFTNYGPARLSTVNQIGVHLTNVITSGLLGGLIEGISKKVLGARAKITDTGLLIGGGLLSELLEGISIGAYQEVQSRSWWFGRTRTNTQVQSLGDDVARQFQMVLDAMADAVRSAAEALGMDMAAINAAIESFRIEEIRISTMDLSPEEAQRELAAVFSAIFDGLAGHVVPFVGQFQRVGEGLGETLVRVASSVQVAEEAVRQLGFALTASNPEHMAQISVALMDLMGGIDGFISGMGSFMNAFATDEHKFTVAQTALNSAFAQFGLTLPETREGMWALMQSLDATTEAGREHIAMLLRMAGVADEYYNQLERQEQERARRVADYNTFINQFRPEDILPTGANAANMDEAQAQAEAWAQAMIEQANQLAIAAGLAGAAEEDLALIHQRAADHIAQAAERIEREAAQRLARQNEILAGIESAIEDFGLSEFERELKRIDTTTQDYIRSLVETGMSLEDATEAANRWRDAALANQRANIFQPLRDDLESMRQQLGEVGMSEFARTQARIARETQEAVARAQRAGASAAEILAIQLNGTERAMAAAALAAADFAAELEDWEFDDYLTGLSESDAERARIDRQWEQRHRRAVEIFGEGSEEATRVLTLWGNAITRHAEQTARAAQVVTQATAQMGDILQSVRSFAEELDEKLAHLRGGDAMSQWLADLSGLPTLARERVRKPLGEVVAAIRQEYLSQSNTLHAQLQQAQQQLANLPWHAQAEAHRLEGRIATLQQAIASISGAMGRAMDELQAMYLASLQGVRDYLDAMLLGDLSALTPAEQLDEAWQQFNAAIASGNAEAATRLADTYLRLLRNHEASGADYNEGFWQVRELLQGMLDVDFDELFGEGIDTAAAQLDAAQTANRLLAQIAANTSQDGGIPAYAAGGWVNGPTRLLAGEAGRELILPNPVSEFLVKNGIPVRATGTGNNPELAARLDRIAERLDSIERSERGNAERLASAIDASLQRSDRNNDASRQRHATNTRRGVTA